MSANIDSQFLLAAYASGWEELGKPSSKVVPSITAILADPDEWTASWPTPDPYEQDVPLEDLEDHAATVQSTMHILHAWAVQSRSVLDRRISAIVEHAAASVELTLEHTHERVWLTTYPHSTRRCLILTHAVMAATLYGWSLPGITQLHPSPTQTVC